MARADDFQDGREQGWRDKQPVIDTMRGAIETTQCPRKANHRPDDWTAKQCFDCKECGCDLGTALAAAAR